MIFFKMFRTYSRARHHFSLIFLNRKGKLGIIFLNSSALFLSKLWKDRSASFIVNLTSQFYSSLADHALLELICKWINMCMLVTKSPDIWCEKSLIEFNVIIVINKINFFLTHIESIHVAQSNRAVKLTRKRTKCCPVSKVYLGLSLAFVKKIEMWSSDHR